MPYGGGYPSGIMASLKSILPGFQRPMPESVEVLKDGTRVPYDSRDPGRFGVTDNMRPPPIDWKKTKLGKILLQIKRKKAQSENKEDDMKVESILQKLGISGANKGKSMSAEQVASALEASNAELLDRLSPLLKSAEASAEATA